eukprot:730572-Rhodomonas_salina.1
MLEGSWHGNVWFGGFNIKARDADDLGSKSSFKEGYLTMRMEASRGVDAIRHSTLPAPPPPS